MPPISTGVLIMQFVDWVLQASPRVQTDEVLVKDISDKLEQGNVSESVFDAVQAKVTCFVISQSVNSFSLLCLRCPSVQSIFKMFMRCHIFT